MTESLYRCFHIETTDGNVLKPTVLQTYDEIIGSGSNFTWPCSMVMSSFLCSLPSVIEGKSVLEIGAGTGLVSVVAALLGAKSVIVTDRDEPHILNSLRTTMIINNVEDVCQICPLLWGKSLPDFEGVDILLGADVFYSTEDFDNVLATFSGILKNNPEAVFLCAYQERRYFFIKSRLYCISTSLVVDKTIFLV